MPSNDPEDNDRRYKLFGKLKSYGINVNPHVKLIDQDTGQQTHRFVSQSSAATTAYIMTWENPNLAGSSTWATDPASFIGDEANKGSEFFQELWIEYCRLFMQGRIESRRGKSEHHA